MAKQKKQLTPTQQAFMKQYNRIMRAVKRAEKKGYIFDAGKLPQIPKRVTQRSVSKLEKIKPIDLRKKAQKYVPETNEIISGKIAIKLEKQQAKEKAKETRRQHKLEKELQKARYEPYTFDYEPDYEEYQPDEPEVQEPLQPVKTDSGYTIDPTTGEILDIPKPLHDREKYNLEHPDTKYQQQQEQKYPRFSTIVIDNFMNDISHFPELAYPMLGSWINELIRNYGEDDVAEMLENAKSDGIWIDYSIAYSRDLLMTMISSMMDYLPDASEQFKKDLAEQFEYGEDWSTPD